MTGVLEAATRYITRSPGHIDAEWLMRRWVNDYEAISFAKDPEEVWAKRGQRNARLLDDADADEFDLLEALVDTDDGTWTGAWQKRLIAKRLRTGPVAAMDPAIERALLSLAAHGTIATVRVVQRFALTSNPVTITMPLDTGERARAFVRLMKGYRKKRAEHAARTVQRDADRKEFDARLSHLRKVLEKSGEWERLVAGSPFVAAWLASHQFEIWINSVPATRGLSPSSVRNRLLEIAREEGQG